MSERTEPAPIATPRSAARRVLVVEDDRRLRELLVKSIREMELIPTAAASGEAALRLIDESEPFAVAVVDLNLPGMHGLDLCERLRREKHPTELIILTGFGDLNAARRAIRLEVVDFLTKPCGMDDLEQALSNARLRWLDRWFQLGPASPATDPEPPLPLATDDQHSIEEAERNLILNALAHHNGNRELAAAEVGISVRKLYYRLRQYQRSDA